jgi:hypothetical protein
VKDLFGPNFNYGSADPDGERLRSIEEDSTMEILTSIERAVLSLTAAEAESLEQIYQEFQLAERAVPLADAADAVRSLLDKGLLSPQRSGVEPVQTDMSRIWRARFEPTPQGREMIERDRPKPPPGWPEGRIYPGMFQGLIPDISAEEIEETRRELWSNFPRDLPG